MWQWLKDEENRKLVSWFGGGLVVFLGMLGSAYVYFDKPSPKSSASATATPSITTGNIQSGGDTVVGSGTIDKRSDDIITHGNNSPIVKDNSGQVTIINSSSAEEE